MEITSFLVTIVVCVIATSVFFDLKNKFNNSADDVVINIEFLESIEEIEDQITSIELRFKEHQKSLDELSKRVASLSMQIRSVETSVNNLIPFIDTTRGMAEGNSRKIDLLYNNDKN